MSQTIKHYEIGNLVWFITKVKGKKVEIAGTVLDSSDISTIEHGYELFKVQLEQTLTGLDGKPFTQKWTHPVPIQGYRLKKRYVD